MSEPDTDGTSGGDIGRCIRPGAAAAAFGSDLVSAGRSAAVQAQP